MTIPQRQPAIVSGRSTHPGGEPRRRPWHGFSLIELMTVVAIVAIMMLVAAPSMERFYKNSQLTAAMNSLSATLATARAEAMRRNVYTIVAPVGTWPGGWFAYADVDNDQAYTAGTDVSLLREPALPKNITIEATTDALPTSGVSYSGNGYPQAPGGGFIFGSVQLTNGLRSRRLVLQPTGQITICDPSGTAGDVRSCDP